MSCPGCRFDNPEGMKFCGECGATLGGVPAAKARAPRDYTPKHLADKILRSKSAVEGERKQVTAFFADVKSSMELSGQLDPEDWQGVLDRFFEIPTEGVHRFEGTVNQHTGDGIMAAELLRREGDPAGAEAELREARRRYKEMGATGHVERLDRVKEL